MKIVKKFEPQRKRNLYCPVCDKFMTESNRDRHLESKKHNRLMNTFYIYTSDKPEKKLMVVLPDKSKIYFGASGYEDYTTYYKKEGKQYADDRKTLYLKRHIKNEDWRPRANDKPAFWARWILWNEPTIKESIEATNKKFDLDIRNYTGKLEKPATIKFV